MFLTGAVDICAPSATHEHSPARRVQDLNPRATKFRYEKQKTGYRNVKQRGRRGCRLRLGLGPRGRRRSSFAACQGPAILKNPGKKSERNGRNGNARNSGSGNRNPKVALYLPDHAAHTRGMARTRRGSEASDGAPLQLCTHRTPGCACLWGLGRDRASRSTARPTRPRSSTPPRSQLFALGGLSTPP